MPKCTGVILSHDEVLQKPFLESSPWLQSQCHLRWGRKCTSWVFQIDAILKKALRDRRSQTIGSSQVHMAITLTITMVCRHNISFLQNSSHHCHPIDFPWKCRKRCWLLGGRLATEPTGSSLQTEQQPDETHTDWGWALSYRGSWPQKILLEYQK